MRSTHEHLVVRTGGILLGLLLVAALGMFVVRNARPADTLSSIGPTRTANAESERVDSIGWTISLGLANGS